MSRARVLLHFRILVKKMSLVLIPIGVIVGFFIPLISIAFACSTFYASLDAIDKLRKRRRRKLRTAHDSLIQIGYSTNVVKSLVVFDHFASQLSVTKTSMETNSDPLSSEYILELTRNQEKMIELNEKLASLKQGLALLERSDGFFDRNVSKIQSLSNSSTKTTKAISKKRKEKESDRKSSVSQRRDHISSNTSSDRKVSKES